MWGATPGAIWGNPRCNISPLIPLEIAPALRRGVHLTAKDMAAHNFTFPRQRTASMSKAAPPAKHPDARKQATRATDEEIDAMLATLTEPQRAKVEALILQIGNRAFGPPMKLTMAGDSLKVSFEHDNDLAAAALTMADLATMDSAFKSGLVTQIAGIGSQGQRMDQGNSNFVLSVVRAVQPRDGVETLLAVQMGAIHAATMMLARRLNHVENIPQQDAAERALNKLARTYAVQMEALKRYRSKGEQRVIVERVTVNQGGQAIVGAVSHGGEGAE